MDFSRLLTSWGALGLVLTATLIIYFTVVVYTRVSGPRSMATMSSFDFAASVAIGSTVATVANLGTPLVHGLVTLTVLYVSQSAMALLRRSIKVARALDNEPILLMDGPTILEGQLRTANLTRAELFSQLRQAGVTRLDEVLAVVMETTGEVSVVKSGGDGGELEAWVLDGVRQPA